MHVSWGVLWVHLVRSSSVGQIGCTIGRSVSFPLSPFHGCVFQRLHARMMCMVLAGQPAPVTPLSFISQVQWVCLRQVSVFHPSAAGAPSFEHSGGVPAVSAPSPHQRMHMHVHAHMHALSLSLQTFSPFCTLHSLPVLIPRVSSRPRGAGLHGQSPVLFLRL